MIKQMSYERLLSVQQLCHFQRQCALGECLMNLSEKTLKILENNVVANQFCKLVVVIGRKR